jgi:hypothetical protein
VMPPQRAGMTSHRLLVWALRAGLLLAKGGILDSATQQHTAQGSSAENVRKGIRKRWEVRFVVPMQSVGAHQSGQ